MGSKLTRQRSLDFDSKLSRRRRQRNDTSADTEKSATKSGGDFLFTSLMLKSDKLPGMLRKSKHSPYVRRVAWIRDIQRLLREQKLEQAAEVLKLLRKDLGLQGTSLNDILYKNAAFLNLVDPISHELLLSLARDLQCPKRETDSFKSTNKICRQLIYHLTPHSKWSRKSVPRRKSQAWADCRAQQSLPLMPKGATLRINAGNKQVKSPVLMKQTLISQSLGTPSTSTGFTYFHFIRHRQAPLHTQHNPLFH